MFPLKFTGGGKGERTSQSKQNNYKESSNSLQINKISNTMFKKFFTKTKESFSHQEVLADELKLKAKIIAKLQEN